MIHRGESSFAYEKTFYQQVFDFFSQRYTDLDFIDSQKRFSFRCNDLFIDFDYGYLDLSSRTFDEYDFVISSGLCALLNPVLRSGDLLFASSASSLEINDKDNEVRIGKSSATFVNNMSVFFDVLCDQNVSAKLKKYIMKQHNEVLGSQEVQPLSSLRTLDNARIAAASGIFMPSQLTEYQSYCDNKQISLQDVLTTRFDGLNCESLDMMRKVSDKMIMFSVGVDKPYADQEFSGAIRDETQWHSALPEMDLTTIYLLKYVIIDVLLESHGLVLTTL